MTAPELQQSFRQPYDRARWLETLRQVLPGTVIFSAPQFVALASERAESILQLGKTTLAGGCNLALLEVIVDEATDLPSNRAALRHLVARYIDQAEYHGVCAIFHQRNTAGYRFTFVAREAALDDDGKLINKETAPRRYTYLLGPNESCRTAAERFELLAQAGAAATLNDVRAAFDKEPLTREFFKRFEHAIEAVKADLELYQKLPSAQAYSHAQLLLERLLFLYFVQNRGWLDQQRDYLLEHFQPHRVSPNEFSYYGDFLERVFFTLSTPPDFKGPGAALRLPGLPFLNGGLFDDDEFAQTTERKKNHPPLCVRNATVADVFENLLEAFNFTAHEDTPLDQDVAVDPEMLGKVFESIVLHAEAADPDAVAPDKRKATGSYYTPRIVVHFICRESLCQYLLPRLPAGQDWNRRLRAILETLALDGLDAEELAQLKDLLTPAEGRQLLDLIRDLRCLDPSVGSGAFPVGLLHELVNLRRICEAAALGYVDPVRKHGNQWVHKQKAEIVENCLYGVDLQQQAIEICRLRLWLSLVVDYDLGCDPFHAEAKAFRVAIRDISQLPNLEMNFRRGDSLLDMISGVPIHVNSDLLDGRSDEVREIQKLGHALHKAKSAEKKKQLRLDILRRRLDLSARVLTDEKKRLRTGHEIRDLYAEEGSDAEKRRRAEAEIKQLDEALDKVEADRKGFDKLAGKPLAADFYRNLRKLEGADFDSPFNFVWRIDYAEIFTGKPAKTSLTGDFNLGDELAPAPRVAGFDLIVGNPPFVTARNPVKRELYRKRWPRVCHMKFLLVCPFFELSFGLLKPGGQLGFIVSNAFAKREFGQPLIEDFFPTVDLQKVVDCSGLLFPGHGTPTCIVFGAQQKPHETTPIRVAATLPGGGDLRAQPEESPLWLTLAAQHNNPGFSNSCVIVTDCSRTRMARHPWNFDSSGGEAKAVLEINSTSLANFVEPIGPSTITRSNEVFIQPAHFLRREEIETELIRPFVPGDSIRNYGLAVHEFAICPYTSKYDLIALADFPKLKRFITPYRNALENVIVFGKPKKETNRAWFEYTDPYPNKNRLSNFLVSAFIATHTHVVQKSFPAVFPQSAPVVIITSDRSENANLLLLGLLNCSSPLFWLKQTCYNKGAGEEEQLDRYEFAGAILDRLPIPAGIANALCGKQDAVSGRVTALSRACWERGRALPALALKKLFEKPGEAYQNWNTSLPGYVAPDARLGQPFQALEELQAAFSKAWKIRDALRAEMIALQEEMDWLVYAAYGLLPSDSPAVGAVTSPGALQEQERPFRLWAAATGDYAKAMALIPGAWSAARRVLWEARLAAIRDNEHIRRIEAPVYKRRWDEQWKVGNSWQSGPVAYAQELVDAFRWWLAEKAEWHLEHKAKGGPLSLDAWSLALANDERLQAAWPAVAAALNEVEAWKQQVKDDKAGTPAANHKASIAQSSAAFIRFLRDVVSDETVPDGIPPAIPWDELEKKMPIPKQAKNVRGKLNVPRERFHLTADGKYLWAGQ